MLAVAWTCTSSRRVKVQVWVPSAFSVAVGISVAMSGSNWLESPGLKRTRPLKTMSTMVRSPVADAVVGIESLDIGGVGAMAQNRPIGGGFRRRAAFLGGGGGYAEQPGRSRANHGGAFKQLATRQRT